MHANKPLFPSPGRAEMRDDRGPGQNVSNHPNRRTAMRHLAGFLAVFAVLSSLTAARADTVTQYLTFKSNKQDLWKGGLERSVAFDLTGSWNSYTFDKSAGVNIQGLGHFSAGASGGVEAGRAGLMATAYANSGTVNVHYPLTLNLTYPSPSTLSPGQTFTLTSTWTPGAPGATPSLVTKSPSFGVKLNGILEAPKIDLRISGRAFGEWIFRNTIFSESFNFSETLLDTADLNPGTKDLFQGILSVGYKQPKINLTGQPVGADLYGYGTTGNADKSASGFITVNGNFTNVFSFVASKFLGLPRLKFTDSISASGLGCRFRGAYDILSLVGSAGIGLEEEVRFRPNPQVTLVINEGNGNNRRVVTFPAGGSVQLTMPSDGTPLFIDPYVTLDNTFYSRTSAYASAAINFYPFDIACALSLPGYTLPTLSYSISPIELISTKSRFGDVFNETFKLGGFDDLFLPQISIVPPATMNPTPLVANDDSYQASPASGIKGPVYQFYAGYTGSQANPLTNDSGPTGFTAVAQHWQPDPTDPDTYCDIDAFGHVTFSFSQAKANNAGIGVQQIKYQITDGKGHFATANLNITLGGGG